MNILIQKNMKMRWCKQSNSIAKYLFKFRREKKYEEI